MSSRVTISMVFMIVNNTTIIGKLYGVVDDVGQYLAEPKGIANQVARH